MKLRPILLIISLFAVILLFNASVRAAEVSAAGACSSPNSHPDARRFYNEVKGFSGWSGNFYKEDEASVENQYKRHDQGGSNNSWVDSSDIHYHVSHGGTRYDSYWDKNLTAILFEDGTRLDAGEARRAWGDNDLEWIAFRNCKLLNDNSKGYWSTAMNGLHLILGFKTNSTVHDNFGRKWARKMKKKQILWWSVKGQTITQAWFNTVDATQSSDKVARVLAEVYDNYNDHLWGQGGYTSSDPERDGWYWWWDHQAGSPAYLPVNDLKQMNVYEVVPRTVDKAYVRQLGSAFGLTSEVADGCDDMMMADLSDSENPQVLEVSKTTGHFNFRNDGKLFVANPKGGQYPPDRAYEAAASFLNEYKLIPPDAREWTVEWDTITEESDQGEVRQQLQQNTNVVWARQIAAVEGTIVSVAGAGARLKAYIAEDGSVMGAMGNWRNIRAVEPIPVNDSRTTWGYFQEFGQQVVVEAPLVLYDQAIPDFETAKQLYYEFSSDTKQAELIPCWLFDVNYYLKDEFVLEGQTFIPASEQYLPPVVDIAEPLDGDVFKEGSLIEFGCKIATFGTPPYDIKWESSANGFMSNQQSFSTDKLSVNCPDKSLDCSPQPHTISVTVTDAKGLKSTDSIQVTIAGECPECEDPADINDDKIVDIGDLAILAQRYLMRSGQQE